MQIAVALPGSLPYENVNSQDSNAWIHDLVQSGYDSEINDLSYCWLAMSMHTVSGGCRGDKGPLSPLFTNPFAMEEPGKPIESE